MIRADQIPDEVVEAGVTAWLENASDYTRLSESIRASIAAALAAWPESKRVKEYFTHDTDYYEPAFILPLPLEVSDE